MSSVAVPPRSPEPISAAVARFGWLASLPSEDGMIQISEPRAYQHDEAGYDQQYASGANLEPGRGLVELLKRLECDTSSVALEIGCGTGLLSLGLVDRSPYPLTLLTDPSPTFLRITRGKLRANAVAEDRAAFAVLRAEDLERVPAGSCSLVALRSTLHHVVDVEAFIAAAARTLVPGGALALEEPCHEGFILMGALAQFLPSLARARGTPLSSEHERTVQFFVDTMEFYSRRDTDKSTAEDKHLFRVDELMSLGARHGLRTHFFANRGFESFVVPGADPGFSFARFFAMYAEKCMSWPPELMEAFESCLTPHLQFLERSSLGGAAPYCNGVFIGRKSAPGG